MTEADNTTPDDGPLPLLVFKYGGNAMRDPELQLEILREIATLHKSGFQVILVHGGGPFIADMLNMANVESEFIQGQRKTTAQAMPWVESALKGLVNGKLVNLCQQLGVNAVGLSGKDGRIAVASPYRLPEPDSHIDLGQVGRVESINPALIRLVLAQGMLPVLCCVAMGTDGLDYNINADVFASAIAGALKAQKLILLTDIDGLRMDVSDPDSHISSIGANEVSQLIENKIVKGGMIPKLQACQTALEAGVESCIILNGMKPESISALGRGEVMGTEILKHDVTIEK